MLNDVIMECEDHIGLITLSRPHALNALTLPMIKALHRQLQLWHDDDAIHAVVVQAVPGKAFCAGGDVRWLYEMGVAKKAEQMQFFWEEYRLNYLIHQFKKPYIALMDGIVFGGGVGISLHGSHPVASERFMVAMPETAIGLFPDIGASYLLSRCPGKLGLYLALTGARLSAVDAYNAGLVKHVIDSDQCSQVVDALKKLDLSQMAHARVSACLHALGSNKQVPVLADQLKTIDNYFSCTSVQDIMRALKDSDDDWAVLHYQNLIKKSPLSLAVTFAQMNNSARLSMEECLKMDYRLVGHFMHGHDFYEGVRALLIDKDQCPIWQPPQLDQVTSTMVANYFE